MVVITLAILLLLISFLKTRKFHIDNIYVGISAIGALFFLFFLLVLYMNIYICYYTQKSRNKIIFKLKNLQPVLSVESNAKLNKYRTSLMLISPTLILGVIPVCLSLFVDNLIPMTFLSFFSCFNFR